MHLQQTKAESRKSGGPQYFFHDLTSPVRDHLRKYHACELLLQTPYGIAKSPFKAVDKDHKIDKNGRIVEGRVGHDRIQAGQVARSIGEEIRYWYGLKIGNDFERIDVQAAIGDDGHFILIPTGVKMRGGKRTIQLRKMHFPLSFHRDYQSDFVARTNRSKAGPIS